MIPRLMISGIVLIAMAGWAAAESLVASHTIRSGTLLGAEDIALIAEDLPGALTEPADAIGMESRVVLYAGRAVRAEDLVPPAVIERNQTVALIYTQGGLAISTDGRSLSRAAAGEPVRVMNLQSRTTVTGTVDAQGRVFVNSSDSHLTTTEFQR